MARERHRAKAVDRHATSPISARELVRTYRVVRVFTVVAVAVATTEAALALETSTTGGKIHTATIPLQAVEAAVM
jgi:hypothetical protein